MRLRLNGLEVDCVIGELPLAESIRSALVDAKCRLIERAAKVVRDVCLADPRVGAARASVTKAGAVANLASATAVLGDF